MQRTEQKKAAIRQPWTREKINQKIAEKRDEAAHARTISIVSLAGLQNPARRPRWTCRGLVGAVPQGLGEARFLLLVRGLTRSHTMYYNIKFILHDGPILFTVGYKSNEFNPSHTFSQ